MLSIKSKYINIHIPLGFINADESVETAGMRELLEETGYTATRVLATSQGTQGLNVCLTDEAVRFVHVEIDGSRPENLNPMQMLDDCEQVDFFALED
jgi:ADP-ribose pyrophosphatase